MAIMRLRFNIQGTSGLPGLHTTYWTGASSTPVNADASDVMGRVRAFWQGLITALPTGVTVTQNSPIDILDVATGQLLGQLPGTPVATVTGTGGAQLPRATMLILRLETLGIVNGRRLQGRSFIGPLSNTANSAGVVAAATQTTLLTAAANMNSGATASLLQVWHRPSPASPSGGSVSTVTQYATNTEFAVLRSRRD